MVRALLAGVCARTPAPPHPHLWLEATLALAGGEKRRWGDDGEEREGPGIRLPLAEVRRGLNQW